MDFQGPQDLDCDLRVLDRATPRGPEFQEGELVQALDTKGSLCHWDRGVGVTAQSSQPGASP